MKEESGIIGDTGEGERNRRAQSVALVIGAGSIYLLPYMRQSYKPAMRRVLGLSYSQLGVASAAFGVAAMASYLPGGWLADALCPRHLLAGSLVATGLAGFGLAAFPPLAITIALHILWGVVTIMTFWPALIRANRELHPARRQGTGFGVLEGGRGIVEGVVASLGLALFAAAGDEATGLRWVIVLYGSASLLAAVAVWRLLEPGGSSGIDERFAGRGRLGRVLRLPMVWLLAAVIFAAYLNYWGTFDIASFGEEAFGMSAAFAATLSSYRMWFRAGAPIVAGLIADRIGASRATAACFALLAASFAVFSSMPHGAGAVWLLWANTAAAALPIFALRGIYYALLEEGGVPQQLTGTATGVISLVGYTPDAFAPLLNGLLLDRFPGGRGHQLYYGLMAVVATMGLAASLSIRRILRRRTRVTVA